jgi:hypothetical protein
VLNNYLRPTLGSVVTDVELERISHSLSYIDVLNQTQVSFVRDSFAGAYNRQNQILFSFSCLEFLAAWLLWKPNQISNDEAKSNNKLKASSQANGTELLEHK